MKVECVSIETQRRPAGGLVVSLQSDMTSSYHIQHRPWNTHFLGTIFQYKPFTILNANNYIFNNDSVYCIYIKKVGLFLHIV